MSKIGHNDPPRIWGTLIMCRDEDGRPDLKWDWELKPYRCAPLPGRTKSGHMRPARDYALERSWARDNKKR